MNPINGRKSCRMGLDNGILYLLYSYYMYVYCRWSYRPWESVEGGSMKPYCQNSMVYIKFYYCIPLVYNGNADQFIGLLLYKIKYFVIGP